MLMPKRLKMPPAPAQALHRRPADPTPGTRSAPRSQAQKWVLCEGVGRTRGPSSWLAGFSRHSLLKNSKFLEERHLPPHHHHQVPVVRDGFPPALRRAASSGKRWGWQSCSPRLLPGLQEAGGGAHAGGPSCGSPGASGSRAARGLGGWEAGGQTLWSVKCPLCARGIPSLKGQGRVWWSPFATSVPRPQRRPGPAWACRSVGGKSSAVPAELREAGVGATRAPRGRVAQLSALGSFGQAGRAQRWELGAGALLSIFPVSVLYCFLLLKLTCLIGNWCRIVSRGLLWNISTAVSFN